MIRLSGSVKLYGALDQAFRSVVEVLDRAAFSGGAL